MTNKYRVEYMNNAEYHNYMMGSFQMWHTIEVNANNKEEAHVTVKANNPDWVINEKNTKTVAEAEAEFKARVERFKAFEEAEEKRFAEERAKRENKLKAKAEAEGMTVEEYQAKIRHERAVKRAQAEVEKLKAELEKAEKKLAKLQKRG